MITANYHWEFVASEADDAFLATAKKEGLDSLAAKLLYDRGIQTADALTAFIRPQLEDLHDPYLLYDMETAVTRIRSAIEAGERILVYGDYDADGMTSAAIIKEALEELGADVRVYLPNRFTDGYGPNQSVYQYFIEREEISLIVTVDNGVAGHEAIAYAQSCGVDVIVTDHHSLQETLPEAFAIIHPEHPKGAYPFAHLAGCGVAFKLATALLESVQLEWLDLVAIGTIADMVSLTGENRVLVQYGLSLLKQTERLGLQELLQIAGVELESLTEETVGFQIAPRLNALGRLDDPNPAVDLLTTFDEEEAHSIAQLVDDFNYQRKELVQTIYDQAKELMDDKKPVQVLAKEGWNPGVLGIVAGRLMEERQQPILVLGIEDGRAKGSARSPQSIDLFQALTQHKNLFIAFGGHAGAAGMTLDVDNLTALSDGLATYLSDHGLDHINKSALSLDEVLDLETLSLATIKSLEKLAPFGMDNPKPVFYLRDFQVESARTMGQQNAHLKCRIRKGQASFDVVSFGLGSAVLEFSQAKNLELAVTVSVNQWNGNTSLQLMLVDARIEGVQLYNIRSKQHRLPVGVPVLDLGQLDEFMLESKEIVLDYLPENLADLKPIFQQQPFSAVYFKNQLPNSDYLDGYASREQFAKLYKTIYQFQEFDVRYKLKDLAQYLKIKEKLLIKMIQIFQELGFVTITDGVMRVNKEAEKRTITDSLLYQDWKKSVEEQELFALGTVEEIYQWLCEKEG